jgi:hypothetical protein
MGYAAVVKDERKFKGLREVTKISLLHQPLTLLLVGLPDLVRRGAALDVKETVVLVGRWNGTGETVVRYG